MRKISLISITILWFCLSCVSTALGRGEDEDTKMPKPVPMDLVNIEAYQKLANESHTKETVEFVSHNPAHVFQILDGSYKKTPEVIVKGALMLPQKSEPVPVVVLSPDSGGPSGFYGDWAKPFWKGAINQLLDKGIGIYILDGFGTRGIKRTWDDQSRYFFGAQFLDTILALKALASDPRIDSERIGVSGHSRGGLTSFAVVDRRLTDVVLGANQHFAAALPMASPCDGFLFQNPKPTPTRVLVLHGSADNYTPLQPCIEHVERMKAAGADVNLMAKEGWHHSFYATNKPQKCAQCVYFYKCPVDFLLTDDGHFNLEFRKYLKTMNEDYERSTTKKDQAAEFVRIYRKIYPKCGGMGVTVGGGHWSESTNIFSKFFVDTLLR